MAELAAIKRLSTWTGMQKTVNKAMASLVVIASLTPSEASSIGVLVNYIIPSF
jgi:hypothetical protein